MLSERLSQTIADVPEIQLAYSFGSGAHDRLEPESDIDVAVAAREPLKMDLKTYCGHSRVLALADPAERLARMGTVS